MGLLGLHKGWRGLGLAGGTVNLGSLCKGPKCQEGEPISMGEP